MGRRAAAAFGHRQGLWDRCKDHDFIEFALSLVMRGNRFLIYFGLGILFRQVFWRGVELYFFLQTIINLVDEPKKETFSPTETGEKTDIHKNNAHTFPFLFECGC